MASKENTNEHENGQEEQEHDANEQHRSDAYEQARSTFDGLGSEEKAAFLVESIINTVADGLKEVSDQVSQAFQQACEKAEAEARKYREAASEDVVDVDVEEENDDPDASKAKGSDDAAAGD